MVKFPTDIMAIINEYKWGIEHAERFNPCLVTIRYHHFFRYVISAIQMELYLY
jgi:hypothetical protein